MLHIMLDQILALNQLLETDPVNSDLNLVAGSAVDFVQQIPKLRASKTRHDTLVAKMSARGSRQLQRCKELGVCKMLPLHV